MIEPERHGDVRIGSDRGFGLVFAVIFAIVALWPLFGDGGLRIWALAFAIVFLLVALIRPASLRPLNLLWFRFGLLLGRVVAPVVMAVLFLVAVIPTALVMRVLGKDPLRLHFDPDAESYWIPRGDAQPVGSMKNQF